MEPNLETVNDYLVSVFNDILTIEESELKKSQFNDLSITEMHTIEAIGMYKKKTSSEVAKELSITVGTLTVAINNLVKKGYVERLRREDDRRVVKLGLTKSGKLLFCRCAGTGILPFLRGKTIDQTRCFPENGRGRF